MMVSQNAAQPLGTRLPARSTRAYRSSPRLRCVRAGGVCDSRCGRRAGRFRCATRWSVTHRAGAWQSCPLRGGRLWLLRMPLPNPDRASLTGCQEARCADLPAIGVRWAGDSYESSELRFVEISTEGAVAVYLN